MTTYATDTMIRANQSGWGTASDGVTTYSQIEGTDTLAISSNEATLTGATDINQIQAGSTSAAPFEMRCRMASNVTSSGISMGLFFRGGSAGNTYAVRILTGISPSNTALTITKYVTNTPTNLATSPIFTITANQFYWVRVQCYSTTINAKYWLDGTAEPAAWTITTTDSTYSSGTFGILGKSAATTNIQSFDSFIASDYITADNVAAPPSDASTLNSTCYELDWQLILLENVPLTSSLSELDTLTLVDSALDSFGNPVPNGVVIQGNTADPADPVSSDLFKGPSTYTLTFPFTDAITLAEITSEVLLPVETDGDIVVVDATIPACVFVPIDSSVNSSDSFQLSAVTYSLTEASLGSLTGINIPFVNDKTTLVVTSLQTDIALALQDVSLPIVVPVPIDSTPVADDSLATTYVELFVPIDLVTGDTIGVQDILGIGNQGQFAPQAGITKNFLDNPHPNFVETNALTVGFVPIDAPILFDDSFSQFLTSVFSAIDSLTLADTSIPNEMFVPVDVLSETDFFTQGTGVVAFVDALSVFDITIPIVIPSQIDTLASVEIDAPVTSFVPVDSTTALEVTLLTLAYSTVDSATLADASIPGSVFVPVDSLTSLDTSQPETEVFAPAEALQVQDVTIPILSVAQTDPPFTLAESTLLTPLFVPVETLLEQEQVLLTLLSAATESSSIAEIALPTVVFVPADVLSETDSFSLGNQIYLFLDLVTGNPFGGQEVTLLTLLTTATDAVATSESVTLPLQYSPVDNLLAQELLLAQVVIPFTDQFPALAELFFAALLAAQLDSSVATDASVKQLQPNLSDVTNSTDTLLVQVLYGPLDALVTVESLLQILTALQTDSLAALDFLGLPAVMSFIDNSSVLSDQLTGTIAAVPIETLSLLETSLLTPVALFTDVGVASDSLVLTALLLLVDALASSDGLGYGRNLVDTGLVSVEQGALALLYLPFDVIAQLDVTKLAEIVLLADADPPLLENLTFSFLTGVQAPIFVGQMRSSDPVIVTLRQNATGTVRDNVVYAVTHSHE